MAKISVKYLKFGRFYLFLLPNANKLRKMSLFGNFKDMRLSDTDIENYLDEGKIVIDPRPAASKISGISVDLTLGDKFRVFEAHKGSHIDLSGDREQIAKAIDQVMSDEITISSEYEDGGFVLQPGGFALSVTNESVTLSSDVVGWLDGRSSLARLGLMVHATAHRIDPGWSGKIVLEFYNAGRMPLVLRPGMCIGALNFECLSSPCKNPYNTRKDAKYKEQSGAVASRISLDGESN